MGINKVILVGRLTKDAELRTTPSGLSVASFTVAVDRYAGKGKEKQADFINCVAWREGGEFVAKYFSKGDMVGVEGSLQVRTYDDKNGNKRYATEVITSNISFVGGKSNNNVAQNNNTKDSKPSSVEIVPDGEDFIDVSLTEDLPF